MKLILKGERKLFQKEYLASTPSLHELILWREEILDQNNFRENCLAVFIAEYSIMETKRSAFAFDMDSTLVHEETLDEIAGIMGIKKEISEITSMAMGGEIDFSESLKKRVALLKGLKCSTLEKVLITLNPGVQEICKMIERHDVEMFLISGGFKHYADKIQKKLGLSEVVCNHFLIENDQLTGEVGMPIIDATLKKESFLKLCHDKHIHLENTIAIGDGANDIPMLQAAGIGIGYCAKAVVRQEIPSQIYDPDMKLLTHLLKS